MASDLDWSHDFCLSCDKQINEGAYCSQACRLADLEKAGTPEPASPINFPTSSTSSWASAPASGFNLPPAINFAAYKFPSRVDSPPTSPTYTGLPPAQNPYFSQSQQIANQPSWASSWQQPRRALSPSSSRSSLSSIAGSSGTQGLSAQAINELRGYASSFDQVRDQKRRLTR